MMSGAKSFVRTAQVAPRAAPEAMLGPLGWLRAHVLAGPGNFIGSLLALGLLLLVLVPTLRFLFVDAVWSGADADVCRAADAGACWPFIQAKISQFIYGFYPQGERWRVNLVFALAVILLAPLLIPRAPLKLLNAILFFGALPVVAFFLLHGGGIDGFLLTWLAALLVHHPLIGVPARDLIALSAASGFGFWLDFGVCALVGLCVAGFGFGWRVFAGTFAVFAMIGMGVALLGLDRGGLPIVETRLWGGLLVTLVVSITGIVASIPVGIALALGRRSRMPFVRLLCVVFIEFWRGVPLVTVLFFATYMLPLFLPGGMNFDSLVRVLIGIALFAGAYNAEVIRGGLAAIARGQSEAGTALGLSRSRVMGLIVLPQALRHVIPSLVNSFIALFKDTTLVLIVSIFDFLGQLRAAFADPNWATPNTLFTGFAFAGMIYFLFCFSMSRYSLFLEARLNPQRKREGAR